MIRLLLLVFVLTACAHAQEKIVLDAPTQAKPGASEFRLSELVMQRETSDALLPGLSNAMIRATFTELSADKFVENGRTMRCEYLGNEAETLIRALNKVDLSNKSLERRITEKCQTDKKLGAGTITGTPQ